MASSPKIMLSIAGQ